MSRPYLPTLLQLRLLTGYLGERAQLGWWPTAFYESSSRLFLEPVFAKSARLAQYHGVVEAARRQHDEHLSVGSYHLFRLPEEAEQDLHHLIRAPEGNEFASCPPASKDAALVSLQQLAGGTRLDKEGPTAVGNIHDLPTDDVLRKIAGVYWSAFNNQLKSYPYLAP
ncbi:MULTISPECIES: BrxE family protein [unclassified Variovorax]|uniref:BrxE family protein n=1 Tax=unclassified Variovorax TaxID=663243 RepID=UPI00076DC717|nr:MULTISPECIES: BrxE family protein [unclassified Variovorax]KWT98895.1 hypothetical protein APY03_0207 [Variovorax sp. WDL1]PNG56042.1 hypothetical protein CHC07_02456 [Variovorax sp. B4]PNG57466.1 hypothetical protein CHC06_02459 [Variovorax sp. B2]VTV10156.1 hypothetical protein WDL1CHR_01171 [Variovorax sp. WDL1]